MRKIYFCLQRLGSVTGEALSYLLGLPLVGGIPFSPHNYSRGDVAVAESSVALLAAFAKTGDPTLRAEEHHHESSLNWPRYELNTQQYLSIGNVYILGFVRIYRYSRTFMHTNMYAHKHTDAYRKILKLFSG